MPSFYSWEEALTSPEDYYFNSSTVVACDHHPPAGSLAWPNPNAPQGQGQMTMGVELWLPTPNTTDTNQTFAQWCYSTQIFQSMNMISEIAWYRRGAGLGENNLGALVWQLNDIWQAPSWAAIEYSGRWKVLNYGMASIYTPVIVYPFWTPDNETLDIMVTNDRPYAVNGTALLTWYDWAGNELMPMVHEFEVPPLNNTVLMSMQGLETILPEGATPTNSWMLLNVSATLADGRTVSMESYVRTITITVSLRVPQSRTDTDSVHTNVAGVCRAGRPSRYNHTRSKLHVYARRSGRRRTLCMGRPSLRHCRIFRRCHNQFATQWLLSGSGYRSYWQVPSVPDFSVHRGMLTYRTVRFELNAALSTVTEPDPADFVVRSVWNNTHV